MALAFVGHLPRCFALDISSAKTLKLGTIAVGSTTGQVPRIPISGQAVFPQMLYVFSQRANVSSPEVKSSNDQHDVDIRLSTCVPVEESGFSLPNSVMAIFNKSGAQHAEESSSLRPLASSVRDCGGKYATIDFRAKTNTEYLLVVSSTTGQTGNFRLESTIVSSPPSPTPLPWGLDRIDQRKLPLDEKYSVPGLTGKTVFVYVLDSGVRISHKEFTSRSGTPNAIHGLDAVERLDYATDCTGHGTHVAAVIAGHSFGVAKDATIISVRVIGCDGNGQTSRVLEGLEFVLEDSKAKNRSPAVVSMSLSTPRSEAINEAVRKLADSGISVVTAAGNTDADSCGFSPASEPTSITVAASNIDDTRPTFSNSGECVDMFAPGQDILSAWNTGDHAHKIQSGTSSACPHVVGAIAVLLSVNPTLPAAAVANMIYSASTFETVANHTVGATDTKSGQANNRLLYVRPIPAKGLARPDAGYMFIYAVLRISIGSSTCSDSWLQAENRLEETKRAISELSLAPEENVKISICCPGTVDKSVCGESSDQPRISLRIQERDRLSSNAFNALDRALKGKQIQDEIPKALSIQKVIVEIEPWVVDSDGNVFWTAPDLRGEAGESISKGAMAAIISCTIAALLALCICSGVFIRKKQEEKKFANYLESVENYKQEQKGQEAIQPISLFESSSPREFKYRENTALQGDILMNLPSTASLHTPAARDGDKEVASGRSSISRASFLRKHPFSQRQPSQKAIVQKAPAGNGASSSGDPGQEGVAATPTAERGLPKTSSFFAMGSRLLSFGGRTPRERRVDPANSPSRGLSPRALSPRALLGGRHAPPRPLRPAAGILPSALNTMGSESTESASFDERSPTS